MPRLRRTKFTVLGALTHGAMSGYDIKKFIRSSIGNFWQESYGQIYPTLRQLAEAGLVSKTSDRQDRRPDRYVYAITDAGKRELREWLGEPAEREVARSELLLKIFFGAQVSPSTSLEQVERYRAWVQEGLEVCRSAAARLPVARPDAPGLPYWLMTVRQGTLVYEALLAWCDETEETLRKLTDGPRAP